MQMWNDWCVNWREMMLYIKQYIFYSLDFYPFSMDFQHLDTFLFVRWTEQHIFYNIILALYPVEISVFRIVYIYPFSIYSIQIHYIQHKIVRKRIIENELQYRGSNLTILKLIVIFAQSKYNISWYSERVTNPHKISK